MNEKEKARMETLILAEGIKEYAYFNRNELVSCLKKAEIDFEVVGVNFAYFGNSKNRTHYPYEFVLNSLIDDKAFPEKVTIRRQDGEIIGDISIIKPKDYELSDQVIDMKHDIFLAQLDDESQKFFEISRLLNKKHPNFINMDYYNAGMLLYLSGDNRTPEKVLEQYLQKKGYFVSFNEERLKWKNEIPTCLDNPALEVRISVAPDVFGTLTEQERRTSARLSYSGYNYGKKRVSYLCFQDSSNYFFDEDFLKEKKSRIRPFFMGSDGKKIPNPIKARDILREISQYAKLEKD